MEVLTFIRLGNGFTSDIDAPVVIEPFIITVRLEEGEYIIEVDDDGNFFVNGENIPQETPNTDG